MALVLWALRAMKHHPPTGIVLYHGLLLSSNFNSAQASFSPPNTFHFFGLDIEEFWLRHMGITAQDDQLKAISHRPAVAPVEALILESMWVIFPSDLDW